MIARWGARIYRRRTVLLGMSLIALLVMPSHVGADDVPPVPSRLEDGTAVDDARATPVDQPGRETSSKREETLIGAQALGGVGTRGAVLLLSGQNGGDVEGALTWVVTGFSDDTDDAAATVLFAVELAGRSLLAEMTGPDAPIRLYSYLVDQDGAVVGHLSEGILLHRTQHLEQVANVGLKFVGEMRLVPGRYSLRLLIRNRANQKFLLASRDLEIPSGDGHQPFVLAPLVPEPAARWVVAVQHGLDADMLRSRVPGLAAWPTARPVWGIHQPLEVVLGCSELGVGLILSARLVDTLGRTMQSPDIEIIERLFATGPVTFYRARISRPEVQAGEYRLVVELTDPKSGVAVSRAVQVVIHPVDTTITWPEAIPSGDNGFVVPPVEPEELAKETPRPV